MRHRQHEAGHHRFVAQHDGIGDVLDALQLLARNRLRMGNVETQAFRLDQRTLLRHVIAKHLAQGLVQQMRCRMVGADASAAELVDSQERRPAHSHVAFLQRAKMHEHITRALHRIRDTQTETFAMDDALITYLTTASA